MTLDDISERLTFTTLQLASWGTHPQTKSHICLSCFQIIWGHRDSLFKLLCSCSWFSLLTVYLNGRLAVAGWWWTKQRQPGPGCPAVKWRHFTENPPDGDRHRGAASLVTSWQKREVTEMFWSHWYKVNKSAQEALIAHFPSVSCVFRVSVLQLKHNNIPFLW